MIARLFQIDENQIKDLILLGEKLQNGTKVNTRYFALNELGIECNNQFYIIAVETPFGDTYFSWTDYLLSYIVPELCRYIHESDKDTLYKEGLNTIPGVMMHALMNKVLSTNIHPVQYLFEIYNSVNNGYFDKNKEVKQKDKKNINTAELAVKQKM